MVELRLGNTLSCVALGAQKMANSPFNLSCCQIHFPGNAGTCPLWDKGFLNGFYCKGGQGCGVRKGAILMLLVKIRHCFWF